MKRIGLYAMVAVAAAACTESPTMPDPGAASLTAFHTTIPAPEVSGSVSGSDVTIDFTWSDNEDWNKLVSFKLLRDGTEIAGDDDIPNRKPYPADELLTRSFTDTGLESGTYEYCVEVMARHEHGEEDGKTTVTHHNSACVTVTVGAEYSIAIVGGSAADGVFAKNAGNFTLTYQLLLGDEVVTDCTEVVTVTTDLAGAVQDHNNCDPSTGDRAVKFSGLTKGSTTPGSVTFTYDGDVLLVLGVTPS